MKNKISSQNNPHTWPGINPKHCKEKGIFFSSTCGHMPQVVSYSQLGKIGWLPIHAHLEIHSSILFTSYLE